METTTRRRAGGAPLGRDLHVRVPEGKFAVLTAEAAAGGYHSTSQYARLLLELGREHVAGLSAADRGRLLGSDGAADGRTLAARAGAGAGAGGA
jgi:hypothetical protein